MAKKQPVLARGIGGLAFLQEGAERRNARAGTNHDDRLGRILWQHEIMRLLHVDLDLGRPAATRSARNVDATPRRFRLPTA